MRNSVPQVSTGFLSLRLRQTSLLLTTIATVAAKLRARAAWSICLLWILRSVVLFVSIMQAGKSGLSATRRKPIDEKRRTKKMEENFLFLKRNVGTRAAEGEGEKEAVEEVKESKGRGTEGRRGKEKW